MDRFLAVLIAISAACKSSPPSGGASATGSAGSGSGSGSESPAVTIIDAGSVAAPTRDLGGAPPWQDEDDAKCPDTSATSAPEAIPTISKGVVPDDATRAALMTGCLIRSIDLAKAYNVGGLVHHKKQRYDNAATFFRWALAADPSYLAARYNLVCALARLGRAEPALGNLEEIARDESDGEDWLGKSLVDPDLTTLLGDERYAAVVFADCDDGCTVGPITVEQVATEPIVEVTPAVPPGNARWTPIARDSSLPDWMPLLRSVPVPLDEDITGGDDAEYLPQDLGKDRYSPPVEGYPAIVRGQRRMLDAPGWWRPVPGEDLIVFGYERQWDDDGDIVFGFEAYRRVSGGFMRIARNSTEDCEGKTDRIGYAFLVDDDRELIWSFGCKGTQDEIRHLRWIGGALRILIEDVDYGRRSVPDLSRPRR